MDWDFAFHVMNREHVGEAGGTRWEWICVCDRTFQSSGSRSPFYSHQQ